MRGPDFGAVRQGDKDAIEAALRKMWRLLVDVDRKLNEVSLMLHTRLALHERSVDPPDPVEGNCVIWMSDGTDAGSDGDLMCRLTTGSATKTATVVDFSAV